MKSMLLAAIVCVMCTGVGVYVCKGNLSDLIIQNHNPPWLEGTDQNDSGGWLS